MLSFFGRQTAPVIKLPQKLSQEAIFILSGLIPNRKSHPLIHEWLGVCFKKGEFSHIETFENTLERTQLGKTRIPNTTDASTQADYSHLSCLIPQAVQQAKNCIIEKQQQFATKIETQLSQQLTELETLRAKQIKQLDLFYDQTKSTRQQAKKHQQTIDINQIFDDYIQWIEDTMTTEKQPYIQVIAVLVGE